MGGRRGAPALLCLLLGACGGGESGGSVADDGGEPRRDPDPGIPTAAGLRFTVAEDEVLEGRLSDATRPGVPATDPFELLTAPARGTLELDEDGHGFRYTPKADFNGTDGFDYSTVDDRVLRASIDITPVPDEPVLDAVPPLVAQRGQPFAVQLVAHDVDGETLRFEARGLPGWLALDAASGELTGTAGEGDPARVEGIVFAAIDPSGRRDESAGVSLELVDAGEIPVLDVSGFPEALDARRTLSVDVLPETVGLEGVTLDVQSDPLLGARVEGRSVILEASDVEEVSDVVLVLELSDRFGESRRTLVPLTLHPLTASGRGRTLLGSRAEAGVHLLVFGDGYRDDEQEVLLEDAERLIELMRRDPGTNRHLAAFNVHVLESVSADSGADDGESVDEHRTRYESYYGCRGVPQLICADTLSMSNEAIVEYANPSQLVLLVNDDRFGGSGRNGIAIASGRSPEIVLHELGHSLGGLGDEYVDGALVDLLAPDFPEGGYPNLSSSGNPAEVPWAHWLDPRAPLPGRPGDSGVGVFEGGLYRERGVYRPTFTSRMRDYDEPFGPVNAERWVLGVYRTAYVVRALEPFEQQQRIVAGDTQRFAITPYFAADVQSIEWTLNGQRLRQADDARVLEISPPTGLHQVSVTVRDVSGLVRLEPPHEGTFTWDWELLVE